MSGGPPTRSDQADQEGLLVTGAPIIDNAVGVDAEVKSPMPPLSDQRSDTAYADLDASRQTLTGG